MRVNVSKIKAIMFKRGVGKTKCDIGVREDVIIIHIEDERVEQVKEFVYMSSTFTSEGKGDRYIERRVNAGNRANGALLAIMNSKSASQQHIWLFITGS
ncbi:hypothetical protein EVAR_829_1 [Eumeta japonica]|uniref:Uncharacterized protein n=1 Tax=Eumeta variegata TaxID=151549 RepID=A0A4C1SDF5_EUMVA|nr:hypothetical protein EVAR_829_1 [Eumeta japonica]